MIKSIILLFASLIVLCCSHQHAFTFYSGYNYTGNSVTVRNKISDLSLVSPAITLNHKSFCYKGYWGLYTSRNFTGISAAGFGNVDYNFCFNHSVYTGSIRYLGASDTNIQSISLYNETRYSGTELTIEGPRYANISFTPSSLLTTSRSNWTLYSGGNFNGTALCFISNNDFHNLDTLNATIAANIKSISKGCYGKIDAFVLPNELNGFSIN